MQSTSTELKTLCTAVRKACERYYQQTQFENHPLKFAYDKYLCGLCAIASDTLKEVLLDIGVNAIVVTGEFNGFMHAWVQLDDTIIDITASQFKSRYPKILITKPGKRFYKFYKLNKDIPQTLHTWIEDQRPTAERKEVIKELARREASKQPKPKEIQTNTAPFQPEQAIVYCEFTAR